MKSPTLTVAARGWLFASVVCGVLAGCAQDNPADLGGDLEVDEVEVPPDGKTDGEVIGVGTYRDDLPGISDLDHFTLLDQGRFLRYGNDVDSEGQYEEFNGQYKLTRRGGLRFIRFYDVQGNFVDRYVYRFNADGTVAIREYSEYYYYGWDDALRYARDEDTAWCWRDSHCYEQGLADTSLWSCEDEVCVEIGAQGVK